MIIQHINKVKRLLETESFDAMKKATVTSGVVTE